MRSDQVNQRDNPHARFQIRPFSMVDRPRRTGRISGIPLPFVETLMGDGSVFRDGGVHLSVI
jgi:hypothetical protein